MTTYHCYTSSLFYNWNFYTKWCHQLQIQDFVLGGKNSAGGGGGVWRVSVLLKLFWTQLWSILKIITVVLLKNKIKVVYHSQMGKDKIWWKGKLFLVNFIYRNEVVFRGGERLFTTPPPFATATGHSYTAVQRDVPLIATTHINGKALIMSKKMSCRKGFKTVNISNKLFFFERCSFVSATVYANKFT